MSIKSNSVAPPFNRVLIPPIHGCEHGPLQELLEDLRQKYSVVRDQSSWGDDTNPFCCDRCLETSTLPGPPEMEPVATLPIDNDDSNGKVNSRPWANDDSAFGTRNPQHPASEDANTSEKKALANGVSRFGDEQGDPYGGAPEPSSNAVDKGDRSVPGVGPTTLLELEEDDTRSTGLVRGAGGHLEVRGDGARGDLPPSQKADAVAAAFSAHLRGVDKYPLELARLCRFAQFLIENELLREAYEVSFWLRTLGALHPQIALQDRVRV